MTEQTEPNITTMPDAEHVTLAQAYVRLCRETGRGYTPAIEAIARHKPGRDSAPEKLAAVARVLRAVVATGSLVDNFVTEDGHVAIAGETEVDPADAAVLHEVLGDGT